MEDAEHHPAAEGQHQCTDDDNRGDLLVASPMGVSLGPACLLALVFGPGKFALTLVATGHQRSVFSSHARARLPG